MEARGRHEASARETRWRHEVGNHQGGTSRRHIGISVLKVCLSLKLCACISGKSVCFQFVILLYITIRVSIHIANNTYSTFYDHFQSTLTLTCTTFEQAIIVHKCRHDVYACTHKLQTHVKRMRVRLYIAPPMFAHV